MTFNTHLTNAHLYPQFLVSKIDKGRKLPCNPAGHTADHTNPKNWRTLEEARVHVQRLGPDYRLGFSIRREKNGGFFLLDIDNCIVDGKLQPHAQALFARFPGCYVEVSQSGKGLHIMGRYTGQLPAHTNKNKDLHIELYTHDRFVMFGEIHPQGDWCTDATEALVGLIAEYFPKSEELLKPLVAVEASCVNASISDAEVIALARNKVSGREAFGDGASFDDLYTNNEEALARAFPTATVGEPYDRSSADMALASRLSWITVDENQIVRIMRTSALVRDKWDRDTYLLDTVFKAVSKRQQDKTLQHNKSTESNSVSQGMSEEFIGCYYVVSEREIYSKKFGLLNQEAFNVCYGIPYAPAPYKTFKTQAQTTGHLVNHLGFRPDLPHGAITQREGDTYINTYKPLDIKMRKGDMTPFFTLLNAMYPNKRDQKILISYAAALVQNPGLKSQWTIILQGVQGCGKSLFADFVAYACGEKYTHRAKGDEFENRFNEQWFGKTLILIEDPRLKEERLEEVLKPLVTQKTLSFEGKGKNARMGDFPANFIITVNDFELIQKRRDARRLAVLMSALQTPEDLINAGLTNEFFSGFARWKETEGNEIVAYYLHNYKVDTEFDFTGVCVTSPHTSTTDKAIEASRSEIELKILEEIEQGRLGFKGGWISSTALTDFLGERRVRHLMPDSQRGKILDSLGYIYHPGLANGLTVRRVTIDNKRPRLFIKKDHPHAQLSDGEEVTTAFEKAQKEDF